MGETTYEPGLGFTMARWVADFLSRGGVGEGSVPVAETTDYPGLKLAHAP